MTKTDVERLIEELTSIANALEILAGGVTPEASKQLPKVTPVIAADALLRAADALTKTSDMKDGDA